MEPLSADDLAAMLRQPRAQSEGLQTFGFVLRNHDGSCHFYHHSLLQYSQASVSFSVSRFTLTGLSIHVNIMLRLCQKYYGCRGL